MSFASIKCDGGQRISRRGDECAQGRGDGTTTGRTNSNRRKGKRWTPVEGGADRTTIARSLRLSVETSNSRYTYPKLGGRLEWFVWCGFQ